MAIKDDWQDWIHDAAELQRAAFHLTQKPGWHECPDCAAAVAGILEVMSRPIACLEDYVQSEATAQTEGARRFYERNGRLPDTEVEWAQAKADWQRAQRGAGKAANGAAPRQSPDSPEGDRPGDTV